ncbi:MAG: nickel pincer cofactor biosynthesis protein LarC [Lachnospiraceae bacterium]|nr:nickel pincer cofactor biosynthesis protein LarC [Lachnospiraceae bacterium]
MKTLYLDCGMGAAGDMLAAALLELVPDREAFAKRFREAGIPGVELQIEKAEKCGITGTHVKMLVQGEEEVSEDAHGEHDHEHDHDHEHGHDHHHVHRSMREIEHIVNELKLDTQIKKDVMAIYRLIAEAESKVHGKEVTEIHFHEVGAMDAIADITAVCMLMCEIVPDEVIASPVATGYGAVRCAHGVLSVPAPATALLLQGIPVYAGKIEAELCTPTGAALLKYFVKRFEQMPLLTIEKTGYGMGKKDFARANCVRAILGKTADSEDQVVELSCNVDDMTGEEIGFAMERLFEAGALEVYTVPVYMKKNRPGTLIRVLVSPEKKEQIVRAMFQHTSTIGIRENRLNRYVLDRHITEVETEDGIIRRKEVSGYGVRRAKWEYDDIARIAAEKGCSIRETKKRL